MTNALTTLEHRLQLLKRHPVAALALGSVVFAAVTNQAAKNLFTGSGILLCGVLATLCWLCATWNPRQCSRRQGTCAAASILLGVGVAVGLYQLNKSAFAAAYLGIALLGILAGIAVCLAVAKQLTWQRAVVLIMLAGYALRLCYVLYTGVYVRQHDIGTIGEAGDGHMGYVEYLAANRHLYSGNPLDRWQYYHPPLHHSILAVCVTALRLLGFSDWLAWESLQFVTLFYSGCIMLVSYKILREMSVKGGAAIVGMALVAFFPAFILFSGGLNNDQLSVLFMLCAFLQALRWYKDTRWQYILLTALCIGLGMMTKLSAGMAAPAVAWLFLLRLIKGDSRGRWRMVSQFAVFALICFPLGLWWPVRNNLMYEVPLTYVPDIGKTSGQYVGQRSIWQRLFKITKTQFNAVTLTWGGLYAEYNMFLALLKTSLFDELGVSQQNPVLYRSGYALLCSAVGVVAATVGAGVRGALRKGLDAALRGFWVILPASILAFYVHFCLQYPQTCSLNMRYASPLVLSGAFFAAWLWQDETLRAKPWGRILRWLPAVCIAVYAVCTAVFYTLLGAAG